MLKRTTVNRLYIVGLITVQDNTMLKLPSVYTVPFSCLITVQDNTMLKQECSHIYV